MEQMQQLETLVNLPSKTFYQLLKIRYLANSLKIPAVEKEAQKLILEYLVKNPPTL